jgi:hypothetical protein
MTSSDKSTISFVITDHARERLKERLRVSDRKIPRLVEKAWNSKNKNTKKIKLALYTNEHHDNKRIYREVLGYVFVFKEIKQGKVLITVF